MNQASQNKCMWGQILVKLSNTLCKIIGNRNIGSYAQNTMHNPWRGGRGCTIDSVYGARGSNSGGIRIHMTSLEGCVCTIVYGARGLNSGGIRIYMTLYIALHFPNKIMTILLMYVNNIIIIFIYNITLTIFNISIIITSNDNFIQFVNM